MSRTRREYLGIVTTYMILKRQQWMKLPKDEDTRKDTATNWILSEVYVNRNQKRNGSFREYTNKVKFSWNLWLEFQWKPLTILRKIVIKGTWDTNSFKWSNRSYLTGIADEFLMSDTKVNSPPKCEVPLVLRWLVTADVLCANPYLISPFEWQLEISPIRRIWEYYLIVCNKENGQNSDFVTSWWEIFAYMHFVFVLKF